MLLLQECYDLIAHVLQNTELAPELTKRRVMDTAGTFVFSSRSWNFANRIEGYGSIVANSKYIDVPFGAIEILSVTKAETFPHEVTFIQAFDRARFVALSQTTSVPTPWPIFATPVFEPQGNAEPKLRLAIWPPQATAATNAIVIAYKAGWPGLTAEDPERTALPIPAWAETFFLEIVRAAALGWEREHEGTFSQRVAEWEAWPSFRAAADQDRRVTPSWFMPSHTWMEHAGEAHADEVIAYVPIIQAP